MTREQIVRIETDGDETKAEVVGEIVRCKDCVWHGEKYCNNFNVWGFKDNDFCSLGRRRETEDMYYPQVDGITPTVIGKETDDEHDL